jgi:hypothetical protein
VSDDPRPPARPLERARDRAVDALTGLYADDELTVEELEERLDRCYRAGSVDELETLFSDLPARPELDAVRADDGAGRASEGAGVEPGAGRPSGRAAEPPAERPRHDLVLGVLSGVRRSGRWTPPRHMNAVAVMGGVELDFRDARFPPGETTLNAVAFWGGIEITVPPGLRVECGGVPLMGGFDRVDQDGEEGVHPGAVLRIRGVACMGAVEVAVKAPGEG